MANILVTGSNGQLGNEIRSLEKRVLKVNNFIYTDVSELDITNSFAIDEFVKVNDISLIINCAAFTAVDKAEEPGNKDLVFAVNASAAKNLAIAAQKNNAWLIHVSTDYVFSGDASEPYPEEVVNSVATSVYGESKRLGEINIIENTSNYVIVRTSWLYSSYGSNFVKTILRLSSEKDIINVVNDQIGSPTYAADLAEAIMVISGHLLTVSDSDINSAGIYHFSNEGVCSWFDFAQAIVEINNLNTKILPVTTAEYPTKTKRPAYSVLDKSKIKATFGLIIPQWRDSLKVCLEKINKA